MERAGSREYGQLDTEGGSAGKATRKSHSPKDNKGVLWTQSTSDAFRVAVGHHMDFLPPPIFKLGPIIF